MITPKNETAEKWRPKRWWIALIAFWLISTVGAGIIARSGGTYSVESGFIIFIMLLFALFAAFTDKSWNVYKRIIWVIGIWIIHAILLIPAGLIATLISKPHFVERTASLIAAIPLVIWSMRRSKFFVAQNIKKGDSTQ